VNTAANSTTVTTSGFNIHVDGTQNVRFNNGEAEIQYGFDPGAIAIPANLGVAPAGVRCSALVTTNCALNVDGGSADWGGSQAVTDQTFVGTYSF
jgi:hypothetical protein